MKFDSDYALFAIHNAPISFEYDGKGNYTIHRDDIAKLLEFQHRASIKEVSDDIEELVKMASSINKKIGGSL